MDPLQDPVPGNSAKKSDSEDDIPLAAVRERKDAKGKVKKSTNNCTSTFLYNIMKVQELFDLQNR